MNKTKVKSSMSSADNDKVSTVMKCLLSGSDKINIGHQIVAGKESTKEAHKVHNVNIRTIQRYAKSAREGKCLYKESGRPKKIDEEGFKNICYHVIGSGEVAEEDIKHFINYEYENTYRRRHNLDDDVDVDLTPLSRATCHRYVKEVKRRLNEVNGEAS